MPLNETLNNDKTVSTTSAVIIYILYLIGLFNGLTAIMGLIIAYVNRDDAPDWLNSHYRFQIRTFWIGVLYFFLGMLFIQFIFGLLILGFLFVWAIVRCAKGLKYLGRRQAYSNPTSWMF